MLDIGGIGIARELRSAIVSNRTILILHLEASALYPVDHVPVFPGDWFRQF